MGGNATRNRGMDILKCICTFLVLNIHFPLEMPGGNYVETVARIAVPIFLMLSGYLYSGVLERGREKAQLNKFFRLFAGANLLYLVWDILLELWQGNLALWFGNTFTLRNAVNFIFLNESPLKCHLWYLGTMWYTLLIVGLFRRAGKMKWLLAAVPVQLLVLCTCNSWGMFLFGKNIECFYTRNFIFVGLPFFCIGYLTYIYRERIEKKAARYSRWLLPVIAALALALCAERTFLLRKDVLFCKDGYFFVAPFAWMVFLWFLFGAGRNLQGPLWDCLATIGRKYSLPIYLLQCMVDEMLFPLIRTLGLTGIYLKLHAAAVYAATLVIAALYIALKEKLTAGKAA